MAIKFLKARIQNFKVFTDLYIDFEDADLVMFDGPNGFGKTTFYDAIELLITGTIKRFDRLSRLVDRRVTYNENPYLNDQHKDGDIVIRVAVKVNEQSYFLSRTALNTDLGNTADFAAFKLYRCETFEDQEATLVADEPAFLEEIFGRNYRENFPFLNYVEQEDHTHLLKNTESEKKQHISHLFNVQQFESVIVKYEAAKRHIGDLCRPEVERSLKERATRIEQLKNGLQPSEVLQYEQLFIDKAPVWDREQISFSASLYSSWLDENGELTLLKKLIDNREDYIAHNNDERLDNIITSPQLPNFLRYYYFVSQQDQFRTRQQLREQMIALVDTFEDLTTEGLDNEALNLPTETAAVLKTIDDPIVTNYELFLQSLRSQRKLATDLERSYTDLQTSRDRLVERFKGHETHLAEKDTTCPVCGQDWMAYDELLAAIDRQTGVLQDLVENSSATLNRAYNLFKENTVQALLTVIEGYLATDPIDPAFVTALLDLNIDDFTRRSLRFELLGVAIDPYLNKEANNEATLQTEKLIVALQQFKLGYDVDIDYAPLKDLYQKYFRDTPDLFMSLTAEQIATKIQYVEWRYGIFQNELIRDEEAAYAKGKQTYDDANALSLKLKEIIDVYKKSLKEYNQDLIRDIEILFHIYSGRIVQDFQGGLGLFIKEDRGIKFVTGPEKTFDAVFSMSAGQLAALIISFTLALNKKYSMNKILFIDDPVQTMDELNIASFIEVLRNDFADRQIFISTHEDMMSTFIRYKFKKQGLRTRRVNMKTMLT